MSTETKKNTWKLIIQLIVSIATAIATTLGVTSCMMYLENENELLRMVLWRSNSFFNLKRLTFNFSMLQESRAWHRFGCRHRHSRSLLCGVPRLSACH